MKVISELKKAIEGITYLSKPFPEMEFEIISKHSEQAIPFLREAVKYAYDERTKIDGETCDYVYATVGELICRCHFLDMLPEIRTMLDRGLIDTMCVGEYGAYVDYMFAFQKCIARMEKEQIGSFAIYDEKYSIHYRSGEWIDELLCLLKKSNDTRAYRR